MKEILFVLPQLIFFYSCNNNSVSGELIQKDDIKEIELILKRGAFQYNRFELKGTELSYIPSDTLRVCNFPEYNKESKVILEDGIVLNLVNNLIEQEIFALDSVYTNIITDSLGNKMEFTCTSSLELYLKAPQRSIKIHCYDYQRACPAMLYDLEKELVKLHGKNLKRIRLPG